MEASMPHDPGSDAERDALAHLTDAVVDLLERLRATSAADERATLGAAFAARIDGLRADLQRRHELTDRDAETTLTSALTYVSELGRAATSCK